MAMSDKERAKDLYLQRTYGITLQKYNEMLAAQNYSCALCEKHYSTFAKSLAVEHNHRTGRVRALACYACNKFKIGRHTIESATKILNYLTKYDEVYDENAPKGFQKRPKRRRKNIRKKTLRSD